MNTVQYSDGTLFKSQGRLEGPMAGDTIRTRPRGSLTREEIIKEALALLEQQGPGALSMRRLADRLGVAPNALYYRVRGKADLIDGLIDQVYADLDLEPDPCRRLDPAADHPQPGHPGPPARPPRRGPLRPPAARPRPTWPAPGRGHLSRPAARRVLRPGRGRRRLCLVDLHPGLRRPGDPTRRHRPPDQRRVRPPHVGLLRRSSPRRVPPHRRDWPRWWPGSPPRISSSSASAPSWPASTPSNRNPSTRPDPSLGEAADRRTRRATRPRHLTAAQHSGCVHLCCGALSSAASRPRRRSALVAGSGDLSTRFADADRDGLHRFRGS